MRGIAVVIDDDSEVLTKVAAVMEEQVEGISLFTFQPDEVYNIPPNTSVFVVDYEMVHTSGPEVVKKIREDCPEAWIVGWGVSSKDPEATDEMIEFFNAGANQIIDKYVENIATVIKTLLKTEYRKTGTLHPSTQFGW